MTLSPIVRTNRTYKSYANALAALERAAAKAGVDFANYIIAATPEGRFAPVVAGDKLAVDLVHAGVTVVG